MTPEEYVGKLRSMLDQLLESIPVSDGNHQSILKILTADLALWRSIHSGAPDTDWLQGILLRHDQQVDGRLSFSLGLASPESPISMAVNKAGRASGISTGAYDAGVQQRVLGGLSQSRRNEEERERISDLQNKIRFTGDSLARQIITFTLSSNQGRSPFLRQLNALILIEEAVLVAGQSAPYGKLLRQLGIENALMRTLSHLSSQNTGSIDDIVKIFRILGEASRLSNPISDGLDRVQKYARDANKDADLKEAGLASGRPGMDCLNDIGAGARQARSFRDRERI